MFDQYLLILTHHVVPKSIGKDGDKKIQWIFGPKHDADRFSGRDITSKKVGLPCCFGWSGGMFRVLGGIIHHGIQVMLIPLEDCVSEAMVEGLCRPLSLG